MTDNLDGRKSPRTSFPVAAVLSERWSPRGFDAAFEIGDATLGSLLEAARWTPSSNNSQPWRFAVARRGEDLFERICATLGGQNPIWAPHAAALIVVCARTVDDDGNSLRWAEYDAGQSAAHLSIQAESMGLSTHQMGGFRTDELCDVLALADEVIPLAVLAVGRLDPEAVLPEPLAQRERAERVRLPLADLIVAGEPPQALPQV